MLKKPIVSESEDFISGRETEGQCDCACQQDSQVLSVWMHVTDACNLDCSYCYLPHEVKHMSVATGQAIIDSSVRSARAHGYQALKLKYAGGEPLLRLSTLLQLHAYALKMSKKNQLRLHGVVLTNGTLLDPVSAAQIHAAGLRVMISLDGIDACHDVQRHYRGGRGSFEDVVRGIDQAQTAGLIPELSITVSSQNAAGLPALIEWVLQRDLPFSINFYRRNEQSAHHVNLDLEEQIIIDAMLSAFQTIEKYLPRRNLLAALVDRANLAVAHSYPCSAGRDYLAFDPSGHVAFCQMQLDKSITSFEAADPLQDLHTSTYGFTNPSVDVKSDCQDCRWKYYCAGGCPIQSYQMNGSFHAKSPNCNIYRALFPEVLRLETLRLAKFSLSSDDLMFPASARACL